MKFSIVSAIVIIFTISVDGQERIEVRNPEIIQGSFLGETGRLGDFKMDPSIKYPRTKEEKLGYHPKKDWPLHEKLNPNALPQGMDPALQTEYAPASRSGRAIDQNYDAMQYTFVNPSDPNLDVSPTHVIQMINGGSGALIQVWDKNGNALNSPVLMSAFAGTGSGYGDPIVLYDRMADRWFISEFASSGNQLFLAVSTSDNPLGTWYIYSFTTPGFPDYPKYAIWPDAYYCTTNENSPTTYAFDRAKILAGQLATMQRFTVPSHPAIGFQATTPVHLTGSALPAPGTPAMFMRMADDGWSASIPADRLEIYTLTVDFNTPANSVLAGPLYLLTDPFDTEINGYNAFSGITQPGTPALDPLREVLMYQVQYRNFGTHESIVCNHVTDVDGNDRTGIRWYELRKTGANPWSIYQQGTYAPDTDNRWMASIAINGSGSIGLMYNIASSTTFPGIRYTGRQAGDPLGTMTEPETIIVAGAAANGSNRYGDYNSLSTDPGNDFTFWGTAQYNPTSQWRTRIASFNIGTACDLVRNNLTLTPETCPGANNGSANITASSSAAPITFAISGPLSANNQTGVFSNLPDGMYTLTITDGNNCMVMENFSILTVADNTLPHILCNSYAVSFSQELSINLDPMLLAQASDACGIQSLTASPSSISCDQVGQSVLVTLTATDNNNNTAFCYSEVSVGGLPCGWNQNPNGINCSNGSSLEYNGAEEVFILTSNGCYAGPPYASDELAYASYQLCGNGSITAQVMAIDGLGWAGVSMRESGAPGSKKAQLTTNLNSNQSIREFRLITNGSSQKQQFPASGRYWLRIVRNGNQFVMYTSTNGSSWFLSGVQNIVMADCIEMGLVLSNYQQSSTIHATFGNVSVIESNILFKSDFNAGPIPVVEEGLDFSVFPNPSSGELNFQLEEFQGKSIRLDIINAQGKTIRTVEIDELRHRYEQMNLSAYPAGTYFVRLKSEGLPEIIKQIVLQ